MSPRGAPFFLNLRNSPLPRSLPLGGLCPRIPYFPYIFYETPFFPEISLDKTRPRSGPHPLSAEARHLVYHALLDVPPRQTIYSSIGSTSTPGVTAKLAAAAAASSASSDPPMAPDADVRRARPRLARLKVDPLKQALVLIGSGLAVQRRSRLGLQPPDRPNPHGHHGTRD